jgi:hypothetical protein
MKKTFTLLMLGVLTLALTAFGFINAQAKSDGNVALQATATPVPSDPDTNDDGSLGINPAANSSVVVWDQFCVRKIPYTILALPQGATYQLAESQVMPTAVVGGNNTQYACDAVGTFRDKQVLVCRGPQLYSFTLQVSDGGTTEDFQVPLKGCPIPRSTADVTPEPAAVP